MGNYDIIKPISTALTHPPEQYATMSMVDWDPQSACCWVPTCLAEKHKNLTFQIALAHLKEFK
jgi:hypothetical protein